MAVAIKIIQGDFGRVGLFEMSEPLIIHAHPDCHVLIKVGGEDACFNVRGKCYGLTEETAILVNAWEPHSYVHCSSNGNTILLALYIKPAWLTQYEPGLSASEMPGFFRSTCVPLPKYIRHLAGSLSSTMLYDGALTRPHLQRMLFELMIAVIDAYSEWRNLRWAVTARSNRTSDRRISKAIELLKDDLGREFDMTGLAARCGLSHTHFFALFRRHMELTPTVYANGLRVEAAVQRLARRDGSLSDLGYVLGFSAPGHFTRFFRRQIGITPSDYRARVEVLA